MRIFRPSFQFLLVALRFSTLAVLWWACDVSPAAAQPADPVDKLRQAIKNKLPFSPTQEQLDYREKELTKVAEGLKLPSELRGALALPEWNDAPGGNTESAKVDQRVRTAIGKKFQDIVADILAKGDARSWKPLADLLGEIGVSIRALDPADKGGFARSLTPSLVELAAKKDVPLVRQAAARALGKINPDTKLAVPALQQLLTGQHQEGDRKAAADALTEMMRTAYDIQKKGSSQTGVAISENELATVASDILPAAGLTVKDSDLAVRRRGLEAILAAATSLNELIVEPFDPNLQPPSGVKWTPEQVIQYNIDRQKVTKLHEMLKAVIAGFREQGVSIADSLNDSDARIRVLARKILEQAASARLRLLRLEASLPNPQGEPEPLPRDDFLLEALKPGMTAIANQKADPDPGVRQATIEFLETLEDDAVRALDALLQLVVDRDRFIRWAAARTLGKISVNKFNPEQREKAVLTVARLLDPNEDSDVRAVVANTLRTFGPDARSALPALIRMLNVGEAESQEEVIKAIISVGAGDATGAIPALVKSLDAKSGNVRRLAAEALGRMGPRAISAIEPLNAHANDDDPAVRLAISDALVNITRPR